MGVSARQSGVSTATQSQGMSSVPEGLLEDEQRRDPHRDLAPLCVLRWCLSCPLGQRASRKTC